MYHLWQEHYWVHRIITWQHARYNKSNMAVIIGCRDHSGYGLCQWEVTLHCNVASHWQSPWPEWWDAVCNGVHYPGLYYEHYNYRLGLNWRPFGWFTVNKVWWHIDLIWPVQINQLVWLTFSVVSRVPAPTFSKWGLGTICSDMERTAT